MASTSGPPAPRQKSSVRDVVNEATKEKLSWLENQRRVLNQHYATVLRKYEQPENKASLSFINELLLTLKTCPEGDNPQRIIGKEVFRFLGWIDMKHPDAMIYFGNRQLAEDIIEELVTYIKNQIEKCEYACMYANAMTQYMGSQEPTTAPQLEAEEDKADLGGSSSEATSPISGSDRKETMAEFRRRVTQTHGPEGFSTAPFEELLEERLFDMEHPYDKAKYVAMRQRVDRKCASFVDDNQMNTAELKLTLGALLQTDLLEKDKAITLRELMENGDALTEVCTLLNTRMKNYATWEWPGPVVVHFKRNMAGRYRAYMDEDILTAILLHYIGAKWSIFLKSCFRDIYSSQIWKRGTGTGGDKYFQQGSIEGFRREFHGRSFLSILPEKMEEMASAEAIYGEEKDDESFSTRSSSRSSKPVKEADLNPMQIKQQLLHIISNEIHLNHALRPTTPLTIVQTDMEWFGPSLVHEVIICLLKFFGVREEWLHFFQTFLEAPMNIGSHSAPVEKRKRGTPMSHQLSGLFGESLLFALDLYVNQESGLSIYRIHDDFWFWSHIPERVSKAWEAIQNFSRLAGLKLNEEKSASIICNLEQRPSSIQFGPEPLPQRTVKWGFLVLHSDGVFRISDELLAPHVKEMDSYLEKSDGVMGWIHGHNRYLRFFIRNFAQPALTFRKQHVVQIMEKLRAILKQIHPKTNGNVVEALKSKYPEIFKGKDVMDSWVHWPVASGGLNLYNPFLELIPLHEAYRRDEGNNWRARASSSSLFASVLNRDKDRWSEMISDSKSRRRRREEEKEKKEEEERKKEGENKELGWIKRLRESFRSALIDSELDSVTDDEQERFYDTQRHLKEKDHTIRIGFEEYCERYRETRHSHWRSHYCALLQNLEPVPSASEDNWKETLFKDQIAGKWGQSGGKGAKFVDANLVPLSLISSMQKERVHKN